MKHCTGSIVFLLIFLASCNNNRIQAVRTDTPKSGTIYISVDESFKPVIEQQIRIYHSSFPDANIIASYKPEVECFKDLQKDSTRMIIVARGLNKNEEDYFTAQLSYKPEDDILAYDAVAIITNITSNDSLFTIKRIKDILVGKEDITAIMDGKNATSTVRYLQDSVLRGSTFGKNVVASNGSEAVINAVAANKKMLAGRLLQLQHKIFGYLEGIVKEQITEEKLSEMKAFLWKELQLKDIPQTKAGIAEVLNRPIRVCGVVKNTGAPGGGPFWVKNQEGQLSLQIVELSQIDISDPKQAAIVDGATHFNPVDLVCGTRDYTGKKYNLNHFVDPLACFISDKTVEGVPIKALEAPGLWNGAMAHWNTIFVEVPLLTFSPVKNVNDLLHSSHQPSA